MTGAVDNAVRALEISAVQRIRLIFSPFVALAQLIWSPRRYLLARAARFVWLDALSLVSLLLN
jgi:hypothetical protein